MIKKDDLREKLEGRGLAESSIRTYIRNLEKLNGGAFEDFKFLEDKEGILKKLKKYKPNTQRSYLISIASVLKAVEPKNKLAKYYYDKMLEINDNIKKNTSTKKLSDTQKKNWLSWEEITSIFNELKEKVFNYGKGKFNRKQYEDLLSLMVTALYIYQEPRRNMDYQLLFKVKNFKNSLPDDRNYINANFFVFNKYKTDRKYGTQRIPISENLKPILELYYKQTGKPKVKPEIFLKDFDGKPLSQVNSITRILNSVFGKNIGSSMLRHIYLTNKFGDKLKEQQQTADNMAHSLQTQKDYIKDTEDTELTDKEKLLFKKLTVDFN